MLVSCFTLARRVQITSTIVHRLFSSGGGGGHSSKAAKTTVAAKTKQTKHKLEGGRYYGIFHQTENPPGHLLLGIKGSNEKLFMHHQIALIGGELDPLRGETPKDTVFREAKEELETDRILIKTPQVHFGDVAPALDFWKGNLKELEDEVLLNEYKDTHGIEHKLMQTFYLNKDIRIHANVLKELNIPDKTHHDLGVYTFQPLPPTIKHKILEIEKLIRVPFRKILDFNQWGSHTHWDKQLVKDEDIIAKFTHHVGNVTNTPVLTLSPQRDGLTKIHLASDSYTLRALYLYTAHYYHEHNPSTTTTTRTSPQTAHRAPSTSPNTTTSTSPQTTHRAPPAAPDYSRSS